MFGNTTTLSRPRQADCRLTDQQLADLIARERPYKVFDGNSLFVLVTPSGQRSWRWRYLEDRNCCFRVNVTGRSP